MRRENRVNIAGLYHVSNRGVGLRDIFISHEDKAYFISTLCKLSQNYTFIVHSFAIISNGYNIIVETKKENLSLIMQVLNTRYAAYFNSKYGRRGHLWEKRFKSWHINDRVFLLELVAYIEYLPVYTDAAVSKERYLYASYRQFVGLDKRLVCLDESIIFTKFHSIKEIKSFFSQKINLSRINAIHTSFNKKPLRQLKNKSDDIGKYFNNLKDNKERNKKIISAYQDGYSQAKIGKALGISQQAVHKIIQKSFI